MVEPIKFNVIIPTRERADTLFHCLHTIVAQDYENLNIIVSDNFSQDNTKEVVASFVDSRVRYINTGKRISMSHNWEFALSHVDDGWVMFLGDDDGLCPGALQLLNKLIMQHDVEAISSSYIYFQWPGNFDVTAAGMIVLPLTDSVDLKDSKKEIKKVFNGSLSYTKLPWLYHGGAASLALLNRLRDKEGRFFCSQIPDLYSAVALSLATDKFLSIQIPIAINGASKHSTGSSFMALSPAEGEGPSKVFLSEENIPFHDSLILGRSLHMILYECYLQSSHIHKNALDISLSDQLRVAVKIAPKEHAQEIRKDCRMIASMNNLPFVDEVNPSFYRIFAMFWSKVIGYRSIYFEPLGIKPSTLNVRNVHEAAIVTWGIYGLLVKDSVSKHTYLIARIVGRIIGKIKRTVTGAL